MKRWILIVSASFALSAPALAAATAQLGPPLVLEELAPPTLYDVATLAAAVSPELPPATLPDLEDAEVTQLAQLVLTAVGTADWKAIAAAAVIVLVWLTRRFGGKYVPWLRTDRGGATLVVLWAIAGAVATALLAGQPFSLGLVVAAITTGAAATGLRKLLLSLIAPNPIPAAEAAGARAAAAVPGRDLEGIANGKGA